MGKKRVGILNGKKVVIGDSNLVTDNEILLKKKGDSIELSVRDGDKFNTISGGEAVKVSMMDFIFDNTYTPSYASTSIVIESPSNLITFMPFYRDGHTRSYIYPNYYKLNPYIFLFNNSKSRHTYDIHLVNMFNNPDLVNKVDKVYQFYLTNVGPFVNLNSMPIRYDVSHDTITITNRNVRVTAFAIVDKDNNVLGLVGEWDNVRSNFDSLIYHIRDKGFKIDTSGIEIN